MGEHKWSNDGETCLQCGDKDWMAGPVCRSKNIGDKHAACPDPDSRCQHGEDMNCPELDQDRINGNETYTIGNYTLSPGVERGCIWIEHASGEGGDFRAKLLEKAIADFYKEHF